MRKITSNRNLFFVFLVVAILVYSSIALGANNVNSVGGDITGLTVNVAADTDTWQGYFGYVDLSSFGYNLNNTWMNTVNKSNVINYTDGSTLASHVGYLFIAAGKDNTLNIGPNLVAGAVGDLDALIPYAYDYSTNIFNTTSDFDITGENAFSVANVPTSYLFDGSGVSSVNFREGLLKDTNNANNLVFVVDLHYQPKAGYNSSQVAYQYIVPSINNGYSVFVYLENTAPTVTLTSPNGDEVWTGTQTITWNANDIDPTGLGGLNISLYYWNSGWIVINDTLVGVNSYSWDVPNMNLADTLINVTVSDDGGLIASDVSDNFFNISASDLTPPIVTILHPNSSVAYTTQTVDLNVTTNENTDACLFDVGSGNTTMNKTSSTSFNYPIDVSSTDQSYDLVVYCNDTFNNIGTESLTFSVDNIQPTITLNYPTSGTNITGTITLSASVIDADVQNVTFEYNNGSWQHIFTNTTAGTSFTYEWDTSALDLTGIAVRATATDDVGFQDSETSYNIEIDNTQPAQIVDLSASIGSDEGEIDLSWTAVGDDTNTGTDDYYIIKYSGSEVNSTTWDSAATLLQSITPQANGGAETYTVTGLGTATTYYFAIKAVDNLGLESTISNSAVNSTKNHDIAVEDIHIPTSTTVNVLLGINATIENQGNVEETSTLLFYVDSVNLENQSVTLAPGEKINKTFNWTPTEEDVGVPIKMELLSVTYEIDTVDNELTETIDVVAAHEISVDSFTHDKLDTTIFKYDIVNISGDITNSGDLSETVTVRLHNGVTIEQNVTIGAGQTELVSFDWNATTEGLMTITATVPGTEGDYSNNDKSLYMSVYSVIDDVNITWYDSVQYPASSESAADFYVTAHIRNLDLVTNFKEIPIRVDINTTSFDVLASRYDGTLKTYGMNVSANTQDYYYWQIVRQVYKHHLANGVEFVRHRRQRDRSD
ncbi:MAG: hypothetical protein U9O94_00775 [Nanoarchaeota archaeon]|nr:hypothetical protein [Nanoarchaeota archaeon]